MSKGEISGYNKSKVEDLRDSINDAAQSVSEIVIDELKNGVIIPISSAWYAEEAQQYFEEFRESVAACGVTVHDSFDKLRIQIEKTGKEWAIATNGEEPTLAELDEVILDLDVSNILHTNTIGDRMLDEGKVHRVIASLPNIEQSIKMRIHALSYKIQAESAFLGHGQSAAIQNCFNNVSSVIHKVFEFLLIGDDSLQSALYKFMNKYRTSAEIAASNYNKTEIEITEK